MAHGDITHLEIPVSDLAAGTRFYGSVFGWRIEEAPGFEGYPMWQAPNGISGGALTSREDGFAQPRSVVEVDSIDDTLAVVESHGGRVVAPKAPISETSSWALVADPDGNVLGLYEEAPEDRDASAP